MTIDFFAHAERELWADAELTRRASPGSSTPF